VRTSRVSGSSRWATWVRRAGRAARLPTRSAAGAPSTDGARGRGSLSRAVDAVGLRRRADRRGSVDGVVLCVACVVALPRRADVSHDGVDRDGLGPHAARVGWRADPCADRQPRKSVSVDHVCAIAVGAAPPRRPGGCQAASVARARRCDARRAAGRRFRAGRDDSLMDIRERSRRTCGASRAARRRTPLPRCDPAVARGGAGSAAGGAGSAAGRGRAGLVSAREPSSRCMGGRFRAPAARSCSRVCAGRRAARRFGRRAARRRHRARG
jgi:hypothetical protein